MKIPIFTTLLAGAALILSPLANAGPFKPTKEKLDKKLYKTIEEFIEMQTENGKKIPGDLIKKAKGIIIVRKVKAGLGLGGEAGGGVALVRDKDGKWSAPGWVASGAGSYGLQIGVEETTIVMLLMNKESLKVLREGEVKVGVDLKATAGPTDAHAAASVNNVDAPILVYTNSGGLFAGMAFEAGGIAPAQKRNAVYYGESLQEVVFQRTSKPTKIGQALIDILMHYSGEKIIEGKAR